VNVMSHEVLVGDCLDKLRGMDAESVDSCVTSPPYYGLRNYGGDGRWWGGIIDCEHEKGDIITHQRRSNDKGSAGRKQTTNSGSGGRDIPSEHTYCIKCDSWFGQLGLEPSPEDFVANLVEIFREVRRVLKPQGTFWLNIGDTFWGGKGKSGMKDAKYQAKRTNSLNKAHHNATGGKGITRPQDGKHSTIKPKDLMMLPHRLAIALQDDGWWVRNDIVWAKPNPMPESVRDRCGRAHEYIFLLTKSKKYYFDYQAVKEPTTDGKGLRTRRDVWTITNKPFKGAHFATYPPDLVEPCILAGCPPEGIVLDPFAGSGTTGAVAEYLGRSSIQIELMPDYAKLIPKRIEDVKRYFDNRKV
jgi:DNA modification methylase|tara:strand:+ start:71 stop:1141 length:1071 start_codon:yes stop_codon:yes gene_type:complete